MNKETTPPLPTPEGFWKEHRALGMYPYQILEAWGRQVVYYTLQQAADNAGVEIDSYDELDDHPIYTVDKQSILSLEEQIIKDLGL